MTCIDISIICALIVYAIGTIGGLAIIGAFIYIFMWVGRSD